MEKKERNFMKRTVVFMLILACLITSLCGCGKKNDKPWLPKGLEFGMSLDEMGSVLGEDLDPEKLKVDEYNGGYNYIDAISYYDLKDFYPTETVFLGSIVSYHFDNDKKLYSVTFSMDFDTEGETEALAGDIFTYYKNLTGQAPERSGEGMECIWDTSEIKIRLDAVNHDDVHFVVVEVTDPERYPSYSRLWENLLSL